MLIEGLEIKDYTLKRFLGRGGFGEVWLAEKKIELADKRVPFALKFLPGDSQRLSDYENVRREINTWIDASGHKNIVSVLDGFIHENFFVIVSEYADGGSLRQWLRAHEGKSPNLEKTVEIMGGILDGLSHLHARRIVHRDLKPENILLKGEIPCIADFGVSRMLETATLTSSQLGTNSAGSPLYMSPESFERTKPSPQMDIWAAGVMLFEMFSGKPPYTGDTIPSLIFEIVTKEPRSMPSSVPPSFQAVVKKSMAKNVSERFGTAKEMREALMKAHYLLDYTPTVSQADLAAAREPDVKPDEKAVTLSSAETMRIEDKKPVMMMAAQNINPTVGSSFKWFSLVSGGLLAAFIGIFSVWQFLKVNTLQYGVPVLNNSSSNTASNSNSSSDYDSNTSTDYDEHVPRPTPAPSIMATNSSQKNVNLSNASNNEKPKNQAVKRPANEKADTESKPARKANKKVSLPDILPKSAQ